MVIFGCWIFVIGRIVGLPNTKPKKKETKSHASFFSHDTRHTTDNKQQTTRKTNNKQQTHKPQSQNSQGSPRPKHRKQDRRCPQEQLCHRVQPEQEVQGSPGKTDQANKALSVPHSVDQPAEATLLPSHRPFPLRPHVLNFPNDPLVVCSKKKKTTETKEKAPPSSSS